MLTRLSLAAVGALQGLALWILRERWPATQPGLAAAVAVLVFIVASALVVHFCWTGHDRRRLVLLAAAVGAIFAAVAAWVGLQLPPGGAPAFGDETRAFSWAIAGTVALYTLGPFVQAFQSTGSTASPYPRLYFHAWNNAFIAALGGIFTIALWAVLVLWGQLFELLGIHWFTKLFERHVVQHLVTGAAVGYGLALGRASEEIIASLRGLTQLLLRVLLPLLSVVTLAFLVTIAVTGLDELYATKRAAFILLGWVAGYLVLFNAVYQDGTGERPYPLVVRRLVEAAAIVMPVMAAIGVHALWLRIDQYGLTPQRMWGLIVSAILVLYAIGYAAAVLVGRGSTWMPGVARVNVALALAVVATALATHTPLLDPLSWSARHQVRRLETGRVRAADFDFGFLRFELGHAGSAALARLRDSAAGADADLVRDGVAAALGAEKRSAWRGRLGAPFQAERFERVPAGAPWPAGFLEQVGRAAKHWQFDRCGPSSPCVAFDADLDADGRPETILALVGERDIVVAAYRRQGTQWTLVGWLRPIGWESWRKEVDVVAAIRAGRLGVETPKERDLVIEGRRFRMFEEE